jgi:hypothetical protein
MSYRTLARSDGAGRISGEALSAWDGVGGDYFSVHVRGQIHILDACRVSKRFSPRSKIGRNDAIHSHHTPNNQQ